ncbi:MAG: methylaspartate mutase accessory protein GlmL [Bacillota bacterium]
MDPILLIDFGSTYTKLTAVDLDAGVLLGTAAAPTTLREGLSYGLKEGLRRLEAQTGPLSFRLRLAASSAAGGLKMVAIGLVPELTVAAARLAALGAGARLLGSFAYILGPEEVARLEEMGPDLVLLAGGTDGGDEATIRANALRLATSRLKAPVIVAGNACVAEEVAEILRRGGKEAVVVPNVLPERDRLQIGPAQEAIRRLFMARIVRARGWEEVAAQLDGILLPTPAAALKAAALLAEGPGNGRPGLGELLVVDVGGATTDVHSLCSGAPSRPEMIRQGLPEPFAKRTVEGDLGMRHSAAALLEAYGLEALATLAGLPAEKVLAGIEVRVREPGYLPNGPEEERLEEALGYAAVATAVRRHAGVLETRATPFGHSYILRGKDLSEVRSVIGTGGVIVRSRRPERILVGAAFDPADPASMRPVAPRYYVDRDYILPTMGLLAEIAPGVAYKLLVEGLTEVKSGGEVHAAALASAAS